MAEIDGARDEAQRKLVQAIAQHSAYLHRASSAQVNEMHAVIDEMGRQLVGELSERLDNLTPAELQAFTAGRYTTSRLKGVRNAINAWAETLGERIDAIGKDGFKELAGHEASYMRDLLAGVIEGDVPDAPTAAIAYAAATSQPILGEFVEDMLADIPDTTRRQVYSTVRQGISQGQTTGEIIRALRGTKALNYRNGILQTTRNNAERIVRTARGHISNVAYEETYKALDVQEVVWVAALELRTCLVAGSMLNTPDGKKAIEKLSAGDMVIGGSGEPRKVAATMQRTTKRLCKLRLSNGETIFCTPDHLVWTSAGWVEAQGLSAGESLPDRL